MKRAFFVVSLLAAAFLLAAVPSEARAHGWHGHRGHGHHRHAPRVVVRFGPGFWWGPPAVWYSPPPVYVRPPRVIVEEPPVYVERAPASSFSYWYYCQSAGAYYPSVPSCPEPWVKVPPRTD
jgi:hypothetical protein